VLSEIERLSGQVCHCGDRGSASETSQLSYASPPMAGASSASSAGYEDAKDQEEKEEKEMFPWWWYPLLIPFVSRNRLYVANVPSVRLESYAL